MSVSPNPEAAPTEASLWDLDLASLEDLLEGSFGEPRYRARQIFHAAYRRGVRELEAMTDLPRELRGRLAERLDLSLPPVKDCRRSRDGSRKYILKLSDGAAIESVYLVDGERRTFCLSSQVGCAFGCDFCLTARMGLVRQLSPGEIVGQVLRLAAEGDPGRGGYNLVFMGMGEPLHNLEAVARALEILMSPEGLALSYRRITLSTVGDVNGIRRLAALRCRPRLAVSLNAPDDALRGRMMPVNRAHPLADLMAALRAYPLRRGERITLEYVLLAGVNDSPEQAGALGRLVRGLRAKVNLIPFNEAPGLAYRQPAPGRVDAFARRLQDQGVPSTVRWSRGADIQAACGQLATEASP